MSRPAVKVAVRAARRFVISIGYEWVDIIKRSIVSALSVKLKISLALLLLYEMQVRFLDSLEVLFSLFIFG